MARCGCYNSACIVGYTFTSLDAADLPTFACDVYLAVICSHSHRNERVENNS
jgi:hypothetical protein